MLSITLLGVCAHKGHMGLISFADRRAVGARLGQFKAGVGLCAVQGIPNPRMEKWALGRIDSGATPQEAAIAAMGRDALSLRRQILLIDQTGHSATRQGRQTPKRANATTGTNFAVGGTGLPSADLVEAMASIFVETENATVPLENRLMAALEETCRSGLWVKGEPQSSVLKVFRSGAQSTLDLRVDCAEDAIGNLRVLLDTCHLENPEQIEWDDGTLDQKEHHAA